MSRFTDPSPWTEGKKHIFDLKKVFIQKAVHPTVLSAMKIQEYHNLRWDLLIHELMAFLTGKDTLENTEKSEHVEESFTHVPFSWWDSFKVRFFPKWALKKWPAKLNKIMIRHITYVTENHYVTRCCPHLPIDIHRAPQEHILWVEEGITDGPCGISDPRTCDRPDCRHRIPPGGD